MMGMTAEKNNIDALVSTVLLVRNAEQDLLGVVADLQKILADTVTDYEIVVVDNASRDRTVPTLETLSNELPNLQVYCLSARVSDDVARVAGIQQAIGDYVILLDLYDDITQIPALLERSLDGNDLVLAVRADAKKERQRGFTGLAARAFIFIYRLISGYDLDLDAPRYRLMSRRLVNYVLQHEDAHLNYLLLPLIGGFKNERLVYTPSKPERRRMGRSFREGASYAVSLVMFTSTVPLRLVTITCCVAASASLIYSVYVVLIYLLKENVAEGWTTLSLQLSVQFFLLALAIGLLAEYMVHVLRQSTKRPRFYIAREFRSGAITREQKLNVRSE
jgi:glycosyltransferase involved in cell wall biosynthesis